MMTIKEMNHIKDELGLTYQRICFESGVPIGTIQKVLGGITKNPRIETMRQLEDAFSRFQKAGCAYGQPRHHALSEKSVIRDSESYASAKESDAADSGNTAKASVPHVYTAGERAAFPETRRTELINGSLYDMAAPSTVHQDICMEVYRQLYDCIRTHHASCHAFIAPTDVYPDSDEYTVVQPDVFIVCDKKKITRKNIQGAPDFIVEVLSSSTRKKDQFIKYSKYGLSGVREYWMIDPDYKRVVVCKLNEKENDKGSGSTELAIYGFSDKIPLGISDGNCEVDMNPIRKLLHELYEM